MVYDKANDVEQKLLVKELDWVLDFPQDWISKMTETNLSLLMSKETILGKIICALLYFILSLNKK